MSFIPVIQSWITPVFSVTWSFIIHSDLFLILLKKPVLIIIIVNI